MHGVVQLIASSIDRKAVQSVVPRESVVATTIAAKDGLIDEQSEYIFHDFPKPHFSSCPL